VEVFLNITHMTYAKVAANTSPRLPELRSTDVGITDFLDDHIRELIAMTRKPSATPPGRFTRPESQTLFRQLHTGSDDEFLASADALTKRLISRMNKATAEGLLICLRAETGKEGLVAGVLKLQVVAPNAAVLDALDSGEVVLTAVKDLLEKPGDLQKGALVTSELPHDEVLCGDRVTHIARYFPEAFDIQIFSRPTEAVRAFFDAVDAHAEGSLVAEVAEAWATVQPGPVRQVLNELGRKVPQLTSQLQADIAERLEVAPRPVADLDTARTVKETYNIGGITVSGPIDEMRRHVHRLEKPDGGWQLIIESTGRPTPNHQ
jgi:hypothetical protein